MKLSSVRWCGALLFLHALLNSPHPGGGNGGLRWLWQPSPDLLLLLALTAIAGLRYPHHRWPLHAATLSLIGARLYRVGHWVTPTFYGDAFNVYNDIFRVPLLLEIVGMDFSPGQRIALVAAVVLLLAAVYWLVYRAWRVVIAPMWTRPRTGVACLVGLQALLSAAWCQAPSTETRHRLLGESMLGHLVMTTGQMIKTSGWDVGTTLKQSIDAANRQLSMLPKGLHGLGGADVLIVFVESYGRDTFTDQSLHQQFSAWKATIEPSLVQAKVQVCSGFTFPSIVGAASALAHAELLCGVRVDSYRLYDALLESQAMTLPRLFAAAGYQTLNVQPAVDVEWPQGRFFGFEVDYFQQRFGYQGFDYHWGRIPDQYALDHLARAVLAPSQRPVFLQFIGVSSHAPYSTVPPWYDDWQRCARPGAYTADNSTHYPMTFLDHATHPALMPAYTHALGYSVRSALGFGAQLAALARPFLLIVLGDHQPPIPNFRARTKSRDVPMHVLTNRPELLQPFLRRAFNTGLEPNPAAPSLSTSEWMFRLLDAFGRK